MKKSILLLFGVLIGFVSSAQITITTAGAAAYNGGNGVSGSSAITFVVENTNSSPWLLTDVDVHFLTASNGAAVNLWYSATSLSGAPTIATPAWTKITPASVTLSVPADGIVPVFTGLNFSIPANTTYRFAVESSLNIRYSGSGAITPNTFTNSGIILKCGDFQIASANVGYGGNLPSPANNPRYFTGAIKLVPAGPCTNPPTAGTAVASSSLVCVGANVNLSLSGSSFGTGQTFQWQSSPNNSTWANVVGATNSSMAANPTANTWYRCAVTCGATTFSSSVQVMTQGGTLSGTYTVNKAQPTSGTNFQSFADLVTALTCGNISGTVTVNVAPNSGPYKEKVVLGSISGSGPSARVLINGNGNELRDSSNITGDRTAFLLNGTDYLTVDSLTITCKGTFGWAVQLTNDASYNVFQNCRMETNINSTSTNYAGVVLSGSLTSATTAGNVGNYNRFENNLISGGYYGISSAGNTTTRNKGNIFIKNRVRDFYFYGMYHSGQDSLVVLRNNLTRPNRTTFSTTYGIYTANGGNKTQIGYNWIHNMFAQGSGTTSTVYGIYNTSSDNLVGKESMVYNNLIENNVNNGTHYLIYNAGSDGWRYYHNTLVYDGANSSGITRGFYQLTLATGIEFKNNLVYINRGGTSVNHAVYAGTITSTMDINNNAYYIVGGGSGGNHYGYYTTNQSTFAAWKLASTYDAASVASAPFFALNSNYKPTAANINNIGTSLLLLVPDDIDGAARSITPDPGVYEFVPSVGPDLRVTSLVNTGIGCSPTTSVDVTVQNIGTDTVFTFDITWKINGVSQPTVSVTDTFNTGKTKVYSLSPIALTGNVSKQIEVTIGNVAPGIDLNIVNNTATTSVRKGYSGNLFIRPLVAPNDSIFNSFTALAQALNAYGVCGPVTVNVQPGSVVFSEQFKLGEVNGASAVNRITINGNGNTIEYLSTKTAERGTIMFDGTDYVTIDSLNITALGSTTSEYGFGVSMFNDANHNIFTRNKISVNDNSTSTNYVGVAFSNSASSATTTGNSGSFNKFIGNTITGGYYGLTMSGSTASGIKGNVAENNKISGFYFYGLYANQQDSVTINSNTISRPTRATTSTFYGIYVVGAGSHNRVMANKIHNSFGGNLTATSLTYGIYITGMNAVAGKPNVVANNMVYNMNGNGSIYGVYISTCDNTRILHNTVALIDPSATPGATIITRGIFQTGVAQNLEIKNNLITINRAGTTNTHLIYLNTAASTVDLNNNAYYRVGNNKFGFFGSDANTFSQWKTLTGKDLNSVAANPFFINTGLHNYTPQAGPVDNAAFNVGALVSTDINNVTRGALRDPGAIEFTGVPCTGLSGVAINSGSTNATVSWATTGSGVTMEWGPANFKQASLTGTTVVLGSSATSSVISGLSGNRCYDVYLTQNCTSSIPGAPPVLGPFTFCTSCIGGGLAAGTYTVGGAPGANNFKSIDSVIVAINGCGIAGPVVFTVRPGVYTVSQTLLPVTGASKTNTITFDGSASLGDTARYSGNAVFNLNGAKHITFKGLTVVNPVGRGFWLNNSADSNTIENCRIYVDEIGTSAVSAGIVSSASATGLTAGSDVDGTIIRNNLINGGYYGIVSYGNSATAKVNKVTIEGNTLSKQYYYGVYAYFNKNLSVNSNTITGLRNTASYGMYFLTNDDFKIEGNMINDARTYGVYISAANTGLSLPPAVRSTFINNMVAVPTTAVYFTSVNYINVFHNSLEGTYGYRQFTPVAMDIRNNIFVGTTNYAFESGTATVAPSIVDYNVYHKKGGTTLLKDGTPTYATLALWQAAALTLNVNSLEGDPIFVSGTNLHVLGSLPNNVGDNTVGVLVDFDNQTRPGGTSTTVDIGADEYTPVANDLALIKGEFIKNSPCLNTNDTIALTVQNVIGAPINFATTPLTASYTVTGPINSTGTITVNTGTLSSSATNVMLGFPVNMSVPGVYTLSAYINPNSVNLNGINDTLKVAATITVYPVWEVKPSSTVTITNTTDTVALEVKSPFFGGNKFFISEVCHFKTTTGAPTGGWGVAGSYPWLLADDYIEITGVPSSDLSGITLEQWSTTALMNTFTFPQGTILSPSGTAIIAVGQVGTSVPSPANFYYHGNVSSTFSSGGNNGRILKDANGNIIDAVGVGTTFSFPAASGVTASDWTGFGGNHSGTSGLRLTGADLNNASNWVVSSAAAPQDPSVLNTGVPLPLPSNVTGFTWKNNGVTISTKPNTGVGPYTTSGVYQYVANYTSPCGVFTDTVTVIVNLPATCPAPTALTGTVVACDSVTFSWTTMSPSSLVGYALQGSLPSTYQMVSGSTYNVGGLLPNTAYDFFVAGMCTNDTSLFAGPYTITTNNAGAPVAAFTPTTVGFSLTVNFDASASAGSGNTYSWDFGDGSPAGVGVTTSHTYATGGSYSVTLTVTNACGTNVITLPLTNVSLGENILSQNLRLFPNPAKNTLHIELDLAGTSDLTIRVMDISGKQVMHTVNGRTGERFASKLDISGLAQGVYMIEVTDGKYTSVRRLIKD